MKKAYNFNAGPCVLPREAVNAAIEALKDFKGTGMSVIEVSHRSKEWEAVMDECRSLWKEILNIPEGYSNNSASTVALNCTANFFACGYSVADTAPTTFHSVGNKRRACLAFAPVIQSAKILIFL